MRTVKTVSFRNVLTLSIFIFAVILHIVLLIVVPYYKGVKQEREDNDIFKIVDVDEYIPVIPEPPEPEDNEEVVEVAVQEAIVEDVIETEKEVIESADAQPFTVQDVVEYLPQHKISKAPELPVTDIKSKIEYPAMARRQGIEAVVYLLLYIDQFGKIRNIEVLQDPGYGFADAAVTALAEIVCIPAEVNGTPVATKFRYPVRFSLN
jgi:periplasmic protein TonB